MEEGVWGWWGVKDSTYELTDSLLFLLPTCIPTPMPTPTSNIYNFVGILDIQSINHNMNMFINVIDERMWFEKDRSCVPTGLVDPRAK